MPRHVVVAAAIQLLTTPIAFCVVAAGSYRTDYGLTCFAVAQVIAFVVFWIGLYRQLDRDVGQAMFLALRNLGTISGQYSHDLLCCICRLGNRVGLPSLWLFHARIVADRRGGH